MSRSRSCCLITIPAGPPFNLSDRTPAQPTAEGSNPKGNKTFVGSELLPVSDQRDSIPGCSVPSSGEIQFFLWVLYLNRGELCQYVIALSSFYRILSVPSSFLSFSLLGSLDPPTGSTRKKNIDFVHPPKLHLPSAMKPYCSRTLGRSGTRQDTLTTSRPPRRISASRSTPVGFRHCEGLFVGALPLL